MDALMSTAITTPCCFVVLEITSPLAVFASGMTETVTVPGIENREQRRVAYHAELRMRREAGCADQHDGEAVVVRMSYVEAS